MTPENEKLFGEVLTRLKAVLPAAEDETDWTRPAFRWVRRTCLGTTVGRLEPVEKFARVELDDLLYIEGQKAELLANTEQFVKGLPANNVLLTGARGTGKSSLIRGCLTRFYDEGLRLIEIDKDDLRDLADIVRITARRPERFILFCDDLSFELGEGGYKALKAALDGSVAAGGDNLIVYATSNRRHLLPEPVSDNAQAVLDDEGELHPGEVLEEKLSLPFLPLCAVSALKRRSSQAKLCVLKPCSLPCSAAAEAAAWRCSTPVTVRAVKNSKT